VLSDGTVACWGYSQGDVLDGVNSAVPVPVAGIAHATAIAVYNGFACAVVSGGDVPRWGNGYVGDGTTDPSATPVSVAW
jgi:hypothetical protein